MAQCWWKRHWNERLFAERGREFRVGAVTRNEYLRAFDAASIRQNPAVSSQIRTPRATKYGRVQSQSGGPELTSQMNATPRAAIARHSLESELEAS